jgi:PhnB protein
MLSEKYAELGVRGPLALGGTTFAIHLHVDHVDALMKQAIEAGATTVREAADQFYGERSGMVRDLFRHEWLLGRQIDNVEPERCRNVSPQYSVEGALGR